MMYIDDATLDRWIQEDAPYLDLTTHLLGIGSRPARLTLRARTDMVVCGTDEARRVLGKLGATVEYAWPNGRPSPAGQVLLAAAGPASALHLAWKLCVNLLEYASGIATRTCELVTAARAVAPRVELVATRKGFPGTRALAIKAVLAGGGSPHRLGLSETVLVFGQHRALFATPDEFFRQVPAWKARAPEKKFLVEAEGLDDALAAVHAGADGIQFDKLPPSELARAVPLLRAVRQDLVLIAAGGIVPGNVAAYAATGVDALATSTVFHGPPADIAATILPAD